MKAKLISFFRKSTAQGGGIGFNFLLDSESKEELKAFQESTQGEYLKPHAGKAKMVWQTQYNGGAVRIGDTVDVDLVKSSKTGRDSIVFTDVSDEVVDQLEREKSGKDWYSRTLNMELAKIDARKLRGVGILTDEED
jgi:hypothetical protein